MNASIFPVRYHDKFYTDVIGANSDFSQFGEHSIFFIFARCCTIGTRATPLFAVYKRNKPYECTILPIEQIYNI